MQVSTNPKGTNKMRLALARWPRPATASESPSWNIASRGGAKARPLFCSPGNM